MQNFYIEIMRVPGLSGSRYQDRGRDLYTKLGSPLGPYKGTTSQNVYLLNQIKNNDYFKSGLPGTENAQGQTNQTPQERIFNQQTTGVKPNTDIYSEDVMKQNEWFGNFDRWTQNFVNDYMRPEWEQQTYDPAMRQMNKTLGETNQAQGNSGSWRSGMANKNLADMAQDMVDEEANMRKEFQTQGLEVRDQVRTNVAVPTYKTNMERWGDSPWQNMDTSAINKDNLGLDVNDNNLNDLISGLNNWTPNANDPAADLDWQVKPESRYTPGLFEDYTTRRY